MNSIKAVLFDLSGVLYDGSRDIPGAADAVAKVRQAGLLLRFVTNTASQSAQTILAGLHSRGIPADEDELFTAPKAAHAYLKAHALRPLYLLNAATRDEFADLDQTDPNCVLLGDARVGLHYESLNEAFRLCHAGMPLIGVGMNKYFRDEQGLNLDAGAFIHAIEWAAGVEAIIMGKPSAAFFDEVVASTALEPHACLMIGDDAIADVKGAMDAGLQGCLVKTGKYQAGDEDDVPPDALVINDVTALPAALGLV